MPTVARPTFCLLIGTRPEAVKLAPVVRAFKKIGIDPLVIATGQHEELVNPILSELQILVTERLATMDPGQELGSLAGRVAIQLQKILPRLRPDAMIVEGDTTSVAIAALTCHYNRVPVIHVEAGLRTGNELNPFPEEVNRKVVSCIARLHFAPTETAKLNLLREGIAPDRIHVVGNTVVDQLYFARDELLPRSRRDTGIQAIRATGRRIILVTGHRRESIGADLVAICRGVRKVAEKYVGEAEVLWPVHLNPAVGKAVHRLLARTQHRRAEWSVRGLEKFLRLAGW
ncbi:MAG: UDP-N-acetylglucosamine 2-epimerase (non-hydrolyzing) [Candidatus Schekmanbacteria bacterium]|nr:UDP-N-acetylglucosamine 2-epimerase (non-hydrolyzing) [Candidatus Schekmanbacteria bacterium]